MEIIMKKQSSPKLSFLELQASIADASAQLTPSSTNGDKIKALRTAQHMSMAELARRASMSDRAIRYIESNQREPSVEAIQKIAAALDITTDYFMDETVFQHEIRDNLFYADILKKYGSRTIAQAKKIEAQTNALLVDPNFSENEKYAFIREMEDLLSAAKMKLNSKQ